MNEDEREDCIEFEEQDRRHKLWLVLPFLAFFLLLGMFSLISQPEFHAFENKKSTDTIQTTPIDSYQ